MNVELHNADYYLWGGLNLSFALFHLFRTYKFLLSKLTIRSIIIKKLFSNLARNSREEYLGERITNDTNCHF